MARSYNVVPLWYHLEMRPRIRDLITQLENSGFSLLHKGRSESQGTNRFYRHPAGINLTACGDLEDIARFYMINDIKKAIELIDNERY